MAYSALPQMVCLLSPTFEVTTEPMARTGRWAVADDTYCTTAWPNGTEQHLYETAAAAGNKYKSNMNLLSRIWRVRSADNITTIKTAGNQWTEDVVWQQVRTMNSM